MSSARLPKYPIIGQSRSAIPACIQLKPSWRPVGNISIPFNPHYFQRCVDQLAEHLGVFNIHENGHDILSVAVCTVITPQWVGVRHCILRDQECTKITMLKSPFWQVCELAKPRKAFVLLPANVCRCKGSWSISQRSACSLRTPTSPGLYQLHVSPVPYKPSRLYHWDTLNFFFPLFVFLFFFLAFLVFHPFAFLVSRPFFAVLVFHFFFAFFSCLPCFRFSFSVFHAFAFHFLFSMCSLFFSCFPCFRCSFLVFHPFAFLFLFSMRSLFFSCFPCFSFLVFHVFSSHSIRWCPGKEFKSCFAWMLLEVPAYMLLESLVECPCRHRKGISNSQHDMETCFNSGVPARTSYRLLGNHWQSTSSNFPMLRLHWVAPQATTRVRTPGIHCEGQLKFKNVDETEKKGTKQNACVCA